MMMRSETCRNKTPELLQNEVRMTGSVLSKGREVS